MIDSIDPGGAGGGAGTTTRGLGGAGGGVGVGVGVGTGAKATGSMDRPTFSPLTTSAGEIDAWALVAFTWGGEWLAAMATSGPAVRAARPAATPRVRLGNRK